MRFSPSWGVREADRPACPLHQPGGSGARGEPTVPLKGNVVLHKGLKVLPLLHHVVHRLLSVPQMVPRVSFQLVPKGSEQAIAVKTKCWSRPFRNELSSSKTMMLHGRPSKETFHTEKRYSFNSLTVRDPSQIPGAGEH